MSLTAMPLAIRVAVAQATVTSRAPGPAASNRSTIPIGRDLPAFVYDSIGDRLLLFGGTLLSPDARTFAWQNEKWSVVNDSGPYYRDDMAAVSMPSAGAMVFFGGHSERAVDGQRGKRQTVFKETWRFESNKWTLVDTSGPEARAHVQGAYDPVRRKFVVFGGTLGVSNYGEPRRPFATDTWEWDGARWTQKSNDGPPGRMGFVMAYDAVSKMVIVHGGVRDNVALKDTWGWNGTRWQQLGANGPQSVYGAAASNPNGGVVLFGGHRLSEPSSPDTWAWNGREWSSVATGGPKPRSFNAMATDTKRKRIYLIGGGDDFWYLTPAFKWVEVPLPK